VSHTPKAFSAFSALEKNICPLFFLFLGRQETPKKKAPHIQFRIWGAFFIVVPQDFRAGRFLSCPT
jgi:hypothetical protein